MSTADLTVLQSLLGHSFKNVSLLQCALTHRSVLGENNERLEFLGDAILSAIVAQELYRRYPNSREGELSRLRSVLVNGESLAQIALQLNIPEYLILGVGEARSGGQFRHSILSDALEAIIGAIYLDVGWEFTVRCVLSWYDQCYADLSQVDPVKDPKSMLQEWLQAQHKSLPDYTAKVTGEPHAQTFYVSCRVSGMDIIGRGESTSRRKAEQLAAQHFLDQLNEK